jgi:hypothetical protein
MSYRPITDVWILARAKLKGGAKFYGAFPGGFLERARALLAVTINDPVLHVCSGMVKLYPYRRGFGPNDKTLDLDTACAPDFLQDARQPFPQNGQLPWKAVLMDPAYSREDAAHYAVGADAYPPPTLLVKNAFEVIDVGSRVGILHYMPPSPPKNSVFVAMVTVMVGFNNRIRAYSVFEKT